MKRLPIPIRARNRIAKLRIICTKSFHFLWIRGRKAKNPHCGLIVIIRKSIKIAPSLADPASFKRNQRNSDAKSAMNTFTFNVTASKTNGEKTNQKGRIQKGISMFILCKILFQMKNNPITVRKCNKYKSAGGKRLRKPTVNTASGE